MLRLRPKPTTGHDKEWKCFFCLHVRSGTIMLGLWHLMLQVMILGFLAAIVRDPRLMNQYDEDIAPELPTPLSNVEPPGATHYRDHKLVYQNVDMSALVTVCTLAITLMLVYGAIRGKPGHLLPFFCLQLFDFAITALTMTGYVCYLRSVEDLVRTARNVPWRKQLLSLPPAALGMVVLSAFIAAIFAKGYCISVVWRCYKWLTMRTHAASVAVSISPYMPQQHNVTMQSSAAFANGDLGSLLPDYEEAVKQTTPPPSYNDLTVLHLDPSTPPPQYNQQMATGTSPSQQAQQNVANNNQPQTV